MNCGNCRSKTFQLMFRVCDKYEFIQLYYCPSCKKIWKETQFEIKY